MLEKKRRFNKRSDFFVGSLKKRDSPQIKSNSLQTAH